VVRNRSNARPFPLPLASAAETLGWLCRNVVTAYVWNSPNGRVVIHPSEIEIVVDVPPEEVSE
jgi:hypothetical protein